MKTICVPINLLSQSRLDFDECKPGDLIELNLSNDMYNKLLDLGFFNRINLLTDSNIDDFEDEHISDIAKIKNVLESSLFDRDQYETELYRIVCQIEQLFVEALNRGTGVFFFF